MSRYTYPEYQIDQIGPVKVYHREGSVLLSLDEVWIPGGYDSRDAALLMAGTLVADFNQAMTVAQGLADRTTPGNFVPVAAEDVVKAWEAL